MRTDVADRQSRRVEPDDLLVHPVDPGLALLDPLRPETAVTVARNRDRQRSVLALQHFRSRSIAAVWLIFRGGCAVFAAQMRRQLGSGHPLHEPDLQLPHQPRIARQVLGPLAAPQKFVRKFLGKRHRLAPSQEAWTRPRLHRRSDTLCQAVYSAAITSSLASKLAVTVWTSSSSSSASISFIRDCIPSRSSSVVV